jgi:hypothetical protein
VEKHALVGKQLSWSVLHNRKAKHLQSSQYQLHIQLLLRTDLPSGYVVIVMDETDIERIFAHVFSSIFSC